MTLAAGTQLGPYQIVTRIGSGAMGEVWRARDTRLHRDVAIKTMSSRDADVDALQRFEQEAQAVSALNHPNILTVHDVGRDDGIAWIVTELIEGESLRSILNEHGTLPLGRLLDIALQIAEGVAAAHDAGIVHRDLKPENIMLTRDRRVKILDFGIAKVMEEARSDSVATSNETTPGLLIGTTAYMSPEQARGTRVSYWTDQFSFGLILYEMATGTSPFRRETGLSTLSAILMEEVPPLESGSPLFQWLVRRLLHKEPDHRYGSMHDVLRELRAIRGALTEVPEEETAPPAEVEAPPVLPRSYALPARWIAAMLICAVLVFAAVALWRRFPAPVQRQVARDYRLFAARNGLDVMPAWSPDGRMIAWSSLQDGVMQIFVSAVSGHAQPLQLTFEKSHCLQPVWSADGSLIQFFAARGQWVVSAAGGTKVPSAGIFPVASGSTLAVVERSGDLVISNTRTGRSDPLTAGPGIDTDPALSPDGRTVAFTSAHVQYRLMRMDPRTGALQELREGGTRATHPAVFPDGSMAWVGDGTVLRLKGRPLWTHTLPITDLRVIDGGARVAFQDAGDGWWILNTAGGGPVRTGRQVPSEPLPPDLLRAAGIEPDALPRWPPVAGAARAADGSYVVSVRRSTAEVWILDR